MPGGVILTAYPLSPEARRKLERIRKAHRDWVAAGKPTPVPPYSGDDPEEDE